MSRKNRLSLARGFVAVLLLSHSGLLFASQRPSGDRATAEPEIRWTSLFDRKSLGSWIPTQFGGEGEVTVEDGKIMLSRGDDMTGVTWRGEPPARMNYEIEVEAMRAEGRDFFCGLTFPVGEDPCTLICGGWGGGITGLSSLDGNDASQNETSQWINYENGQWYRIRVRVTPNRIEAWLDDKQIVNADTTGRKIGIRPEVDPSRPLGIATWRTTAAIRSIRLRNLESAPPAPPKVEESSSGCRCTCPCRPVRTRGFWLRRVLFGRCS